MMRAALLSKLKLPLIFSTLLVLPFVALEWINRQSFNEGFPFVLFSILWLLPIPFFAILLPIVQDVRAGNNIFITNPVALLLKVALLALIAIVWSAVIVDQLPCFLGIPNCD